MSNLSLRLFGSFEVFYDGERLTRFRTLKVQALLAYLVAGPPATHQREALMTLLWPDLPPRSAQVNLRQILYQLRKAIPEVEARGGGRVPFLLNERLTVSIHGAVLFAADTATFDSLLGDVRRHEHNDILACPLCSHWLEQAVTLYRGDFLADLYLDDSNEFEAWANGRREAYRGRALDALATLAGACLRRGDHAQAQVYARRQLELDNLDERAYRQLMEAQARAGRRSEAAATYETARRRLREELGMTPSAQTTRLVGQIEAGQLVTGNAEDDLPKPPAVRGYRLLDELGAGALGRVYRAYQPVVGREVAIKVIRPRYANHPDFIRRFEAEAQTVARLEHPHIVPLYDYWREPDNAYLVMRWLRGGSLAARLAGGALLPAETVALVEQIAAALQTAHRRGVIHRDVKAANILLDEDRNAYLSDFSMARETATAGDLLAESTSSATVSPEQLLREELSPQSDQYSLAVVAYQMLTGRAPFPGDVSRAELRRLILTEPLPPATGATPGLPAAVDDVLRRATAKRPGDRFPDVGALAEALRRALVSGPAPQPVVAPLARGAAGQAAAPNPYKGLRAFEEGDAESFFGRMALARNLVERLVEGGDGSRPAGRFLAVVGPSGSGKSSLVKAGLIPALRADAVPGSAGWFIAEMTPGNNPFEELVVALRRVAVDPPVDLLTALQHDEQGLSRVLRRVLPQEDGRAAPQLLLVVDQFEELFTLTHDATLRQQFIHSLLAALGADDSRLRVVATLRADFYDRPLEAAGLGEMLRDRTAVVLPMSRGELEQAIVQPAARVGVELESGLPAAILADAVDQPGSLPLVQYALTELFERRENGQMTLAGYETIGGVTGALGRRADAIYDSLSPSGQEAARQMFLRLVTLGEGVEDTRRRALRSELEGLGLAGEQGSKGAGESPSSLVTRHSPLVTPLEAYGRARLLTFDRDPATRGPTVEVAHEALLREWGRLRGWLNESRADVRMQRLLAGETADWLAAGEGDGYLLRGSRLDQFEGWTDSAGISLTGDERAFLDASVIARQRRRHEDEARRQRELATARQLAETERQRAEEQARSNVRLRRRALLLTGALALAGLLAVVALLFARSADQSAAVAATRAAEANANAALAATRQVEAEGQTRLATSRELTQAALNSLANDTELGILLALRALETAETREAQEALHRALQATRTLWTYAGVTDIVDTPEGPLLVSVGEEAITVTDPNTDAAPRLLPFSTNEPGITYDFYAIRGGNGLALLSWPASRESVTFHTWDLSDEQALESNVFPIQLDEFSGLALSPDGQLLAVGYENGTAELWDTATGQKFMIAQHDDWVWSAAFDEDGRRLATLSPDGQISIWDLPASLAARDGQELASLNIATDIGRPSALAFIDESRVAIGTHVGSVQVWDVADRSPLFTGQAHNNVVQHLSLNADLSQLASANTDGLINLWDMRTGELLLTLSGSATRVLRSYFNAAGTQLITLGDNQMARVWDVRLQPLGELGSFTTAPLTFHLELSPDNERLATGSEIVAPSIWNPSTGERLYTIAGPQGGIFRVAYNADGSVLAGAGRENLVYIWDAASGELLLTLDGHGPGTVADGLFSGTMDVAFSPDGTRLVSAGTDGVVKIWDARTGDELHAFTEPTSGVLNLDYSPDGRLIAASTYRDDSSVYVWDAATGEQRYVLRGHEGDVWGLAFSPDGSRLVSGSEFGIVIAWDMASGERLYSLTGHLEVPFDVAFTPDGRYFVTTGEALRVWRAEDGAEVLNLYEQPIYFIAISGDGRRLYAVDIHDTVQVFTLLPEDTIALAHERLTRWWRPDECQQYLHTEECPPPPERFAASD